MMMMMMMIVLYTRVRDGRTKDDRSCLKMTKESGVERWGVGNGKAGIVRRAGGGRETRVIGGQERQRYRGDTVGMPFPRPEEMEKEEKGWEEFRRRGSIGENSDEVRKDRERERTCSRSREDRRGRVVGVVDGE